MTETETTTGKSRRRGRAGPGLALAAAASRCAASALPPASAFLPPRTVPFPAAVPRGRPALGAEEAATTNGDDPYPTSIPQRPARNSSAPSLWRALGTGSPAEAFRSVFGNKGQRGEYMDGYAPQEMEDRCACYSAEDYGWDVGATNINIDPASERGEMMAALYSEDAFLWDSVGMVAFAEHYVLVEDGAAAAVAKPYESFLRQRDALRHYADFFQIYGGVVWGDWEALDGDDLHLKLEAYRSRGIDYVRMHCHLGEAGSIGGPARIADESSEIAGRLRKLTEAAKACQEREMVPLVLLQAPWRETPGEGGEAGDYFEGGVKGFAEAAKDAGVEPGRLLFETRPPVGISAREERALDEAARKSLGLETGRKMFSIIEDAFEGGKIAGFCVAGGSTKGDNPTAMEDDTQNAVRQGIRQSAKTKWGYELCFWEMGAKLMLQPKVGQLWGEGEDGREAACELFCENAEALSREIVEELE